MSDETQGAVFKIKVGEHTYELADLTLGEARTLKQDFGVFSLAAIEDLVRVADPDAIAGMIYLCLRREDPEASREAVMARVDSLDLADFEPVEDDATEDEAAPKDEPEAPQTVEGEASPEPSTDGETTPAEPGPPSSPEPSESTPAT